jgi:threonine dehydratase
MSDIKMIEAAAVRLKGHARRTPILTSPFLDEIAGRRVLLKAEALQHTGSFKFRGGWSALSALDEKTRARGVFAFSSGNHAQGVAMAAKMHGVPAVILMPSDAPAIKIANTRALGAEVVTFERGVEDRESLGIKLAAERNLTLIRPYDEPLVIAGQGTTGLEIAEQAAGGLTSGIALALEAKAPGMRVRPVEPEDFDDVSRSLIAGEILSNKRSSGSICDAIITPQPGDLTFPIMQRLCGPGIVVPEEDCLRAMALAFTRLKLVIEPGGAIALAAALFHGDQMQGEAVIVTASGGNVDAKLFKQALDRFGD